jgi:phosphatidate cytidylyltransferase
VVTGLVAAAVAVVCFALGTVPTLILTTVIVGLAAAEFYEALRRAGYHPATLVGLLGCVAIVPIAYDQGKDAFPMMLFLVVAFSLLWYLFEVMRARPLINVALTIMVFVYVGGFGAFAGLFLAADDGVGYILGIVLAVVAYDVVGWFVGSNMGRTPLMPRISPNKTVEGLLGGMAAAFIVSILVSNTVSGWDQGGLLDGILLGLVIAVMAPLGDLVESMIKRDLGVKDLGTMLPGHGGIADRFDALLFVLPAAYYVAVHIVS